MKAIPFPLLAFSVLIHWCYCPSVAKDTSMKAGNISHSDSAPIATAKIDQFNYISNTSSEGFLEMLKMFRKKDLDPSGEMAKRDFYPKPDHTPVDIVHQIHWGPIEERLVLIKELTDGGNSRVALMEDSQTKRKYVLKIHQNNRKYTNELNLGRLKGPYFVTPICTMEVTLPIKTGSALDQEWFQEMAAAQAPDAPQPRYKYVTRPAILMEYIDGMRADDYAFQLAREAGIHNILPVFNKITKIIAQLFAAICEIHRNGLVYHDFKPENLLVRADGNLAIIDYDCMAERTEPYRGSINTTAPEQWQFIKGPLHNAVDFWSYGATSAILLANVFAGMYWEVDRNMSVLLRSYLPIGLDISLVKFTMRPLPGSLHPASREFLYPFFSPDPDARRFLTHELRDMIRKHPFFQSIDWEAIENPEIDSIYYKKSQEEIRAMFLADTERKVVDYNESLRRRQPHVLYHLDDYMMASDAEESANRGVPMASMQPVAKLVGVSLPKKAKV